MTKSPSVPSVAVVIVCYNYGRFLREALSSVLSQSHAAHQVIVVDDGSTDDTQDVCRSYGSAVEYVYQPNAGANAARNLGLRHTHDSEFVVFLDADDRIDSDYIRKCLAALKADPGAAFAYTQWQKFGNEQDISTFPPWSVERILRKNFVHISALMRRDVLGDAPFDVRLRRGNMDWDLYLTLAERGHRGVLVDEPLLQYRQHGSSVQDARRRRPYARATIAVRLAWKHRRLYGWSGLVSQVLMQSGEIATLAIRRVPLRIRGTVVGCGRRGMRLLRQIPRRFPGR